MTAYGKEVQMTTPSGDFQETEPILPKELKHLWDTRPTIVVIAYKHHETEVEELIRQESERVNIRIDITVQRGSVELIVRFLVDVFSNPTVAVTVGGILTAIAQRLLRGRWGRIRSKDEGAAFTNIAEHLARTESFVRSVESIVPLEKWGHQFVITDNRGGRFIFDVAHKCDTLQTRI